MTIFSLLWAPEVPEYAERARVVRSAGDRAAEPVGIGSQDVVIVSGAVSLRGRYEHLRTARRLQRQHPGLGVVVSDATWYPRSALGESRAGCLQWVLSSVEQRLLMSLDRGRTRYCFLTEEERISFSAASGVPLADIAVTPFFPTVQLEETFDALLADAGESRGYVFSGGNAVRDYALLREALGGTDIPVRIATRNPAPKPPPNFTEGPVPHAEFFRLMASALAVVVPMDASSRRSAGQQSYLNAMRLGKPTVVNDALGVRALTAGGAFVVPARDPSALRDRVRWIMDSGNREALQEVVACGVHLTSHELTQRRYYLQLLEIAEQLQAG